MLKFVFKGHPHTAYARITRITFLAKISTLFFFCYYFKHGDRRAVLVGDIQNQKMLDLVLEADPTQERTKLVLTKADRIEVGDEDRWLDIVRGGAEWAEKYARVHGAHIVRARTPMGTFSTVFSTYIQF